MKIGYIRCSSVTQNTIRQEVLMQELGVDEVFIDKLSGKNTDRPQLNKTIFIDKTLSYANNSWFLSTPKTARSTRTIAIDDTAIAILKKHREEQNKQKEIVGAAWQHPEMVFTSCTGHWYDRSLLNSQFRRFISKHTDELELKHNITIHGLRHTNAALLLYAGEDIENISAHLGHASSDITSRVYAHMYAEVKIRMAKTVSDALFRN